MIGADSNILLRLLLKDDAKQAERVRHLLDHARAANEVVLVSPIALCETVWVLRSGYGKSKAELVESLTLLLETAPFQMEREDLVRTALRAYRTGTGDFADYLIGETGTALGCRYTVTFDKALQKAPGFSSL